MSSIFPSQNTWATPRTTAAKLDSNNCMIILPQKISEIKKVIVNAASVDVIFGQSGETSSRMQKLSTLYFEQNLNSSVQNLDITDYVVEEAKYNTLEIKNVNAENVITELCANNAHYYEHNGNIIYVIGQTFKGSLSFWAKTSAWNMAIQASFEKILANNTLYNYNANTQQFTPIYSRPLNVASLKNNPMDARFRVYYTPLGESVKLAVPKTNPQGVPFCIPYSQQQPIVDNVSHGREMQSIANRTNRSLINPSKESSVLQW